MKESGRSCPSRMGGLTAAGYESDIDAARAREGPPSFSVRGVDIDPGPASESIVLCPIDEPPSGETAEVQNAPSLQLLPQDFGEVLI